MSARDNLDGADMACVVVNVNGVSSGNIPRLKDDVEADTAAVVEAAAFSHIKVTMRPP